MRGQFFTIPLGTPFLPAVAAWLVATYGTGLPDVTVWLPNQASRATLTAALATQGVTLLPNLRLLRAEEPGIAASAPNQQNALGLRLLVAQQLVDGTETQAASIATLYQQHLLLTQPPADDLPSPTWRALQPVFNHLTTTLARHHQTTPAAATRDALSRTLHNPGPQVVAGILEAHGAARDFLQALTQRDTAAFLFPALPLDHASLPSQPGAALAYLLGHLQIMPDELTPLSLPGHRVTESPSHYSEAPHPLAEATAIRHLVHTALENNQSPVHILCPDAGLRATIAASLRAAGLGFRGTPLCLGQTPAGRLFNALLQALAAPEAITLAELSRALNLSPWLDTSLWRGVAATTWPGWADKLAGLTNDELPTTHRPAVEQQFTQLRGALEKPAAQKLTPAQWANTATGLLDQLAADWQALPGAPTLRRWLAEVAQVPANQPWSAARWATFAAPELDLVALPDDTGSPVLLTGLIEARLLHAGTVILAGANEGAWPGTAPLLLGDAEGERLGLPGPKQRLRLTAAEWHLALHAAPQVFITRSLTDGRETTRPSRFLNSLKTTAFSADATAQSADGMASASSPNLPGVFTPTEQFLALAWSPSWVEDLTQCPYRALGKRRLGLREPDTYNADPTAEGHGLWVHRWLARFWQTYRGDITDTATARAHLLAQGERELKQQAPLIRKLWQPRLGFMSDALLTEWQKHTTQGRRFLAAEADLTGTIGNVDDTPLRARADHIDDSPTGWWLVDYKTGGVPGIGKIRSGEKPQLLLEAWLAEQAGHQVAGVEYLQLKGHGSRPAKSTTHARDKLAAELAQTGPWVAALAQRYGVHQTFPAAPVYGGGLSPRGHCKTCALGGVCRWAETTPPEPAA